MSGPAVTSDRVGGEIVDRAYALAYFLHPDHDRALRLTSAALAKLKLAVRAQSRRIYYQPARADRRRSLRIRGRRTKVALTDIQILQRLILVESERFERELEADHRATFEDSLVWFVKHVVRIVLKRNSLHTCVAITRLLHDYPTAEAQDIYGALIQDPDRVPDDAYFRSVKRRLLRELTERFAERIRVVTVERGEMRLESLESAGAWSEYLSETLVRCTPWETSCALQTSYRLREHAVEAFGSASGHPDDEHRVELRRMHALVHPRCWRLLCHGLDLEPPDRHESVPRFTDIDPEPPAEGGHAMRHRRTRELDEETRANIEQGASAPRGPGRRPNGEYVRITVDGAVVATLTRDLRSIAGLELGEGRELIEVWRGTPESEVLQGVHLIEPANGEPGLLRFELEAGELLDVILEPSPDPAVGCRLRARWSTRGYLDSLRRIVSPRGGASKRAFWATVAAGSLAVSAVVFVLSAPPLERSAPQPGKPVAPPVVDAGATRGGIFEPLDALRLSDVGRVHVDPIAGPRGEAVAHLLRRGLMALEIFEISDQRDSVDAVLKGSATGDAECSLQLQLVDAAGRTLWSFEGASATCDQLVELAMASLAVETER